MTTTTPSKFPAYSVYGPLLRVPAAGHFSFI